MDRRQCGQRIRAQFDVVETDHRDIARYSQSLLMDRAHRAYGSQIVGPQDSRRQTLRLQNPHHRVMSTLNAMIALLQPAATDRDAMLLQRSLKGLGPGLRRAERERSADECNVPVSQAQIDVASPARLRRGSRRLRCLRSALRHGASMKIVGI